MGTSSAAVGGNNNNGSRFNTFTGNLFYGPSGVQLKKIGSGGSGAYHNDFYSNVILFEGARGVGLHLLNGDNNSFTNLFAWNYAGTSTHGVRFGPSVATPGGSALDSQMAYNNYFFHLQATGVTVDNDARYAGSITGLDLANSGVDPVIGTNANLTYTMEGYNGNPITRSKWKLASPIVYPSIGFNAALTALTGESTSSTGVSFGRTSTEYNNFLVGTTNFHTSDETSSDVIFRSTNTAKRFSFYFGDSTAVPVFSMRSYLAYATKPLHALDGFVSGTGKGLKLFKDGNFLVAPTVQWFLGHSTNPAGVIDGNLHFSSDVRTGTWEDYMSFDATERTVGVYELQHLEMVARPTCNAARTSVDCAGRRGRGR